MRVIGYNFKHGCRRFVFVPRRMTFQHFHHCSTDTPWGGGRGKEAGGERREARREGGRGERGGRHVGKEAGGERREARREGGRGREEGGT